MRFYFVGGRFGDVLYVEGGEEDVELDQVALDVGFISVLGISIVAVLIFDCESVLFSRLILTNISTVLFRNSLNTE